MNIPKNLKYTKDHEWIKLNGEEAIVGITDYAQGELGDIVFIEVETVGEKVDQGGVFGTIEAVKTVSDLFMPVTGVVKELNSALEDSPDLINSDPFGEGWIIKLKVENISEMENLLDAAQYSELLNA
ncbi:MAG: glycine cleavage system protein GcvH [Bacteroidales bacterium]|jgi:glycine cleavage system H protein|nr:glycine cleavage system protein GcvH [Bacteroidales bacterium]